MDLFSIHEALFYPKSSSVLYSAEGFFTNTLQSPSISKLFVDKESLKRFGECIDSTFLFKYFLMSSMSKTLVAFFTFIFSLVEEKDEFLTSVFHFRYTL